MKLKATTAGEEKKSQKEKLVRQGKDATRNPAEVNHRLVPAHRALRRPYGSAHALERSANAARPLPA